MVRAPYTLRWQIELLFKQLTSILRVHQSSTGNIHRLRCELYGKLLAAVLVHRLHAVATPPRWQAARQESSIEKLYKRVQERAFTLAQLVLWSRASARRYWSREMKALLTHCQKYRQRSRMTTLEILEAGVDPKLYTGNAEA